MKFTLVGVHKTLMWFANRGIHLRLDLNGENGLLKAVVIEISPSTVHHAIPQEHPLAPLMRTGNQASLKARTDD